MPFDTVERGKAHHRFEFVLWCRVCRSVCCRVCVCVCVCVCVHVGVEGGRVHDGGVKRERETEKERTKTFVSGLMRK